MEEDVAKLYAEMMVAARDETQPAQTRAAAAIKAACIAKDSMALTVEALDYAARTCIPAHYYVEDKEGGEEEEEKEEEVPPLFDLPDAAVVDLGAVLAKWCTASSPIAEYAWEIVTACLNNSPERIAKWDRSGFLALADKGLQ